MVRGKGGLPPKLELTSIIDIVFLLLIFFLVVTSVVPYVGGGQASRIEETINVPDTEAERATRGNAFIVLYPFDITSGDIGIYLFDDCTNRNDYNSQRGNLCNAATIKQFRHIYRKNFGWEVDRSTLFQRMENRNYIVLSASPAVPIDKVMDIYDLCRSASPSSEISFLIGEKQGAYDCLFGDLTFLPEERTNVYR